jgi:hypothetical protein
VIDGIKGKYGKLVTPRFKNAELGLHIEATPRITGDEKAVDASLSWKIVTLEGWQNTAPGIDQPQLQYNAIKTEGVLLGGQRSPGFVHIFDAPVRGTPVPGESVAAPVSNAPLKRLIIGVAATILPTEPKSTLVTYHGKDVLIRTSLRIFQISEKAYAAQQDLIDSAIQAGDLHLLEQLPGYKLLSDMAILTKPGERSAMEKVRVVKLPKSVTRDADGHFQPSPIYSSRLVGSRAVIEASFSPENDDIEVSLFPETTQFLGFAGDGDTFVPVFNTCRLSAKMRLHPGRPVPLWLGTNVPSQENALLRKPPSWMEAVMTNDDWKKAIQSPTADGPPMRLGCVVDVSVWATDGNKVGKRLLP